MSHSLHIHALTTYYKQTAGRDLQTERPIAPSSWEADEDWFAYNYQGSQGPSEQGRWHERRLLGKEGCSLSGARVAALHP